MLVLHLLRLAITGSQLTLSQTVLIGTELTRFRMETILLEIAKNNGVSVALLIFMVVWFKDELKQLKKENADLHNERKIEIKEFLTTITSFTSAINLLSDTIEDLKNKINGKA